MSQNEIYSVGEWTKEQDDETIFEMIFYGLIKDFSCPYCEHECEGVDPNTVEIKCKSCDGVYYSPLYNPEIGL